MEVPPDIEVALGFIVQAETADAAAAAVREVGGIVTHELTIIRAVGATLDSSQLAVLRNHEAVGRVYEDAAVTTSSSCGVVAGLAVFENSRIYWTISNNGTSTAMIGFCAAMTRYETSRARQMMQRTTTVTAAT